MSSGSLRSELFNVHARMMERLAAVSRRLPHQIARARYPRSMRAALAPLVLGLEGLLLGLGSGSALELAARTGPIGGRSFQDGAFFFYGCAAAALVLVTSALAVAYERRRPLPRVLSALMRHPAALPGASLLAGLGLGFYAGTYVTFAAVQWSLSSNPPLRSIECTVLAPRWIFLPLAAGAVGFGGRSAPQAIVAAAALAIGYEIGFPLAQAIEERLWNIPTWSTDHLPLFALATAAVLVCAVRVSRRRDDRGPAP
jgi:hypothetical protein